MRDGATACPAQHAAPRRPHPAAGCARWCTMGQEAGSQAGGCEEPACRPVQPASRQHPAALACRPRRRTCASLSVPAEESTCTTFAIHGVCKAAAGGGGGREAEPRARRQRPLCPLASHPAMHTHLICHQAAPQHPKGARHVALTASNHALVQQPRQRIAACRGGRAGSRLGDSTQHGHFWRRPGGPTERADACLWPCRACQRAHQSWLSRKPRQSTSQ